MSDSTTLDATASEELGGGEPGAYLLVSRDGRREVIDLGDGDVIVFGRGADATVQLDDARASREHARITRKDGAITVADLGSRNGTRVNGERLGRGPRVVGSGDLVTLGGADVVIAEALPTAANGAPPAAGEGVVLADPAMVRVFGLLDRVAPTHMTVLLLGETGVGKEIAAERLHRQSGRAGGRFLCVNCGSLPAALLESELFGHERGAFTGAERQKPGLLESAHGGTLFLDEIGELALPLQAHLLRVLETGRFMRIGGREELSVDVRVVAATHRELAKEVQAGRFREDLYFRLAAFTVTIPPLRERAAELPLLAELFLRRAAARAGQPAPALGRDALAALERHRWPGNVRELKNAVERALVVGDGKVVRAAALPDGLRGGAGGDGEEARGGMREQLADVELQAITAALEAERGNQTRAAARLGISRRALIYKMGKLQIARKRS